MIIKFPTSEEPEDCIYSCDCGNATFILHDDGVINCAVCDEVLNVTCFEQCT